MEKPDPAFAGTRAKPRLRSLALALVLGLLVTLTASVPASAQSQNCDPDDGTSPNLVEPVEICGTVVLEGSAPGAVKVHFPEDVFLSTAGWELADIDVEGDGPFTGVLITRGRPEPDVYAEGDASFLLAGCFADRFGFTWPSGDRQRVCDDWSGGRFFQNRDYDFPAGDYLIHLVTTEGHPARVTLRFASSLKGSLALSPQHASTVEMQEYEPDVVPEGDAKVFDVDGRGEIRDQGISVAAIATSSSSEFNASSENLCSYQVHHIYREYDVPVSGCPLLGATATYTNVAYSITSTWAWRTTGKYGYRVTGAHAPADPPRVLLMWVSAEYPAWV